jgi:hypothetical protein
VPPAACCCCAPRVHAVHLRYGAPSRDTLQRADLTAAARQSETAAGMSRPRMEGPAREERGGRAGQLGRQRAHTCTHAHMHTHHFKASAHYGPIAASLCWAVLGAITLFLFRSHDRCHRCFGVSFASRGCSGLCPRLLLGRAVHHGPLHGRGRSGDGDRLATLGRLVCWVDSAALFCLWALLPVGRHLRPALRARPSCSPHLGGDGTGLSGAAAYMQRCMYSW